jgi:ubiquinone/menaquinone biosynthesis C-methylase UbiE
MTRIGKRLSLETLIETEDVGLEILHPGGLEITRELAELCHISKDTKVLDVASGTGESAFYLVQNFGCRIIGIDISDYMIKRARRKAIEKGVIIEFKKGDAHNLPFIDNAFDAVISECTTCLLNKEKAIGEMVRVAKKGGYVGIHDICWKEGTPLQLKHRLAELEGERPETLTGWKNLFEKAGLKDVKIMDRSYLITGWRKDIMKKIGMIKQIRILVRIVKKWGLRGLDTIMESEKIFQSQYTEYGIIVGRKP